MIDHLDGTALAADFPALAHTLGPRRFATLCDQALAAADATGTHPGSWLPRIVTRFDVRRDGTPSRLSADIAALEWAIVCVRDAPVGGASARSNAAADPGGDADARAAAVPGADADAQAAADHRDGAGSRTAATAPRRALLRDEVPDGAHLRPGTVIELIDAVRLVPVAFRLDAYLRRVESGRRPPPPSRADQTIAVYRPRRQVHRLALEAGEGRMLHALHLGADVADACALAVARGWVADLAAARRALDFWIGEGLVGAVRPSERAPIADEPRAG